MVSFVKKRLNTEESGFTLIELLVVMIIISILMAVAIPVFLGQKQKALATNAKQNAKHVQDTLESCAAGTTTGTFIEGAFQCNTAALLNDEPSLSTVLGGTNCGGAVCVTVSGLTADSYVLASRTNSTGGSGFATFTLTRNMNGVVRTCTGSTTQAAARMCPTGKW